MPDVNTLRQRISELENDLAAQGKELKEKLQVALILLLEKENQVSHLHIIAESQSEEVQALSEERNELKEVVDRLTTVPQAYGTVVRAYEDGTADVNLNGQIVLVGVIPSIKASDLTLGTRVRINTETDAIVALAPHDDRLGEEFEVQSVLDEATVLVQDKTGNRSLVRIIPGILSAPAEKGTRVVVCDGILTRLMTDTQPGNALGTASTFALAEAPDMTFEDIAGHDELIQKIYRTIMNPYEYPRGLSDYVLKPEFNILLHGPGGCGKTSIAKAVANLIFGRFKDKILPHAKGNFIAIMGPQLHDRWWGETERMLREVFAGAENLYRLTGVPVVVFFDDCESFLLQRGTSNSSTATMDSVNQFNTLVQGIKPLTGVSIILATNFLQAMDTTVVRRMHQRFYVPPPSTPEMVEAIVRKHLRGAAMDAAGDPVPALVGRIFDPSPSNDVIEIMFEDSDSETVPLCQFLSGSLLADIVRTAKNRAVERDKLLANERRPSGINAHDMLAALQEQLENSDSLPTSKANVEKWLSQRSDKRRVLAVNALRDRKKLEARAKLHREVDRTVQ